MKLFSLPKDENTRKYLLSGGIIILPLSIILLGYVIFSSYQYAQQRKIEEKPQQLMVVEPLRVEPPQGYPEPKEHRDIFDSFVSYEFYNENNLRELDLPVISSVKLASEESVQKYISDSSTEDIRNRRASILEDFRGQKEALNSSNDYKELKLKKIGDNSYLISPRVCRGDIYGCSLVMYTTFVGDIRANISVGFDAETKSNSMDELVAQIQIMR